MKKTWVRAEWMSGDKILRYYILFRWNYWQRQNEGIGFDTLIPASRTKIRSIRNESRGSSPAKREGATPCRKSLRRNNEAVKVPRAKESRSREDLFVFDVLQSSAVEVA